MKRNLKLAVQKAKQFVKKALKYCAPYVIVRAYQAWRFPGLILTHPHSFDVWRQRLAGIKNKFKPLAGGSSASVYELPADEQPDVSIILPVYNHYADTCRSRSLRKYSPRDNHVRQHQETPWAFEKETHMMAKITTIVTTYNHRDFVAQALESAIAQTGDFKHEILVADDASTDGTADIVRDYAKRYPGLVKDISNTENLGISGNLKHAFGLASGEYIAILEGDDYWTDERKLEKQLTFLEENRECQMAFSRIRLKSGETYSTLSRHENLPEKLRTGDLLSCEWKNPICNFSCCLFRKEAIHALPDVAYEYRLSEMTVAFYLVQLGPIGYLREIMSVYRLHDKGTFSAADDRSKWEQALRSFMTVRKVAGQECWGPLTKDIEGIKRELSVAQSRGKPRLSVVTITYNNLAGLKKTAESVARQTWSDFEWIVVDGGSKDGSEEFLRQFSRPPDILISERDDGVYDAMNKGINLAQGEYCICMNAGDKFREASTLEQAFSHEFSADVVYGDWARNFQNSEEQICRSPVEMPPFFFFMPSCNICQQAMFVRTRVLQDSNFDTKFKIYGDWAKWRQLMLDGRSFQYIPLIVCDFEAGTGLSEQITPALLQELTVLQAEFPEGVITQSTRIASLLAAARAEAAACRASYEGISSSACWRMTKPLRFVLDSVKALFRRACR